MPATPRPLHPTARSTVRPAARPLWWVAAGLAACLCSPSAWALYKVVGPDGRVTYTDRPPAEGAAKPLNTRAASTPDTDLPYELAQAVSRYPVTLYTSRSCGPCDSGRALLRSRGIPFQELTVNTSDDVKAYARIEATDQLPVLRVGSQQLKGYSAQDWNSYLDAANYPTSSQLPAGYIWASARALAGGKPAASDAPDGGDASPATPPPSAPADAPSGFRF